VVTLVALSSATSSQVKADRVLLKGTQYRFNSSSLSKDTEIKAIIAWYHHLKLNLVEFQMPVLPNLAEPAGHLKRILII